MMNLTTDAVSWRRLVLVLALFVAAWGAAKLFRVLLSADVTAMTAPDVGRRVSEWRWFEDQAGSGQIETAAVDIDGVSLEGIVVSGQGRAAILSIDARPATVRGVGESIRPGLVIEAIEPDYVQVSSGRGRLFLSKPTAVTGRDRAVDDLNGLNQGVGLESLDAQTLERLGLSGADRLLEVDGLAVVALVDDAESMNALLKQAEVSLTILRDGRIENRVVETAYLADLLQTAANHRE